MLMCSPELPFLVLGFLFFEGGYNLLFNMVGLPLFGKEGSGIPVFKILVRALTRISESRDTGLYL